MAFPVFVLFAYGLSLHLFTLRRRCTAWFILYVYYFFLMFFFWCCTPRERRTAPYINACLVVWIYAEAYKLHHCRCLVAANIIYSHFNHTTKICYASQSYFCRHLRYFVQIALVENVHLSARYAQWQQSIGSNTSLATRRAEYQRLNPDFCSSNSQKSCVRFLSRTAGRRHALGL